MGTMSFERFVAPRRKWRYPGVAVPVRLENKYWDYSRGPDPRATVQPGDPQLLSSRMISNTPPI